MRQINLVATFLALLTGCSSGGVDSHTEVFKTPEQASKERYEILLKQHKELAVSVLKFARPDVEAKVAEGPNIAIAADGVSRTVDLTPIEDQLVRQPDQERNLLRHYLTEQLRPFDVERLKTIGFAKARKWCSYELVNGRDLDAMQKQAGDAKLVSAVVVTNLHRVAVIRRGEPVPTMPVTAATLEAWHVTPEQVDEAATANLKRALGTKELFSELAYGGMGRSGTIKQGVPAAVILLPEFLQAVQKAWDTNDDLVLFAPGPGAVTFVERRNDRLLTILVPQWRKILADSNNPLSSQLLIRDREKLALFVYQPPGATKPATAPATKAAPYIVH
jgi:hypothetical protein